MNFLGLISNGISGLNKELVPLKINMLYAGRIAGVVQNVRSHLYRCNSVLQIDCGVSHHFKALYVLVETCWCTFVSGNCLENQVSMGIGRS